MSLFNPVRGPNPNPEKNKVLSLSHPMDYVRLLSWSLWKPQRIQEYLRDIVERHQEKPPPYRSSMDEWLQWLENSLLQRNLLIQNIVLYLALLLILSLLFGLLSVLTGVPAALYTSLLGGILISIVFGTSIGSVLLLRGQTADVVTIVTPLALAIGVMAIIMLDKFATGFPPLSNADYLWAIVFGTAIGLLCELMVAQAMTTASSIRDKISETENSSQLFVVVVLLILVWLLGMIAQSSPWSQMFVYLLCGLGGFCLAFFRVDDWLQGFRALDNEYEIVDADAIPRRTPIPVVGLHSAVLHWLDIHWQRGLDESIRLMDRTRQGSVITKAIVHYLQQEERAGSDQLVGKVRSVTERISSDTLYKLLPNLSGPSKKPPFLVRPQWLTSPMDNRSAKRGQRSLKEERQARRAKRRKRARALRLPLDSKLQASFAGFLHLQRQYPGRAQDAFARVQDSADGKEMMDLCQALKTLWDGENLIQNERLSLPKAPANPQRKEVWTVLGEFQKVHYFAALYGRCKDADIKEIIRQRAAGIVQGIQKNAEVHALERGVVHRIAEEWKESLEALQAVEQRPRENKPVVNPFDYSEPIKKGMLQKGRKTESTLVADIWKAEYIHSLLIWGGKQTGKTSFILNCGRENANVELIYCDLGLLPQQQITIVALLKLICSAVEDLIDLPGPSLEQLNENRWQVFEWYLKQTCSNVGTRKLIIVLDRFELFELRIQSDAERSTFMHNLWHLQHLTPNLGVAFVATLTPHAFHAQCPDTFAPSVQPIKIGCLDDNAVTELLQRPVPNFMPFITEDAIETIQKNTTGQPFLLQLVGSFLIQHYNKQIKTWDPYLISQQAQAALSDPQLRSHRDRYFQALLQQPPLTPAQNRLLLEQLMVRAKSTESVQAGVEEEIERDDAESALKLFHEFEVLQIEFETPRRYGIRNQWFKAWLRRA